MAKTQLCDSEVKKVRSLMIMIIMMAMIIMTMKKYMTILVFMTADLNRGRGQYYENGGQYFGNVADKSRYFGNIVNVNNL